MECKNRYLQMKFILIFLFTLINCFSETDSKFSEKISIGKETISKNKNNFPIVIKHSLRNPFEGLKQIPIKDVEISPNRLILKAIYTSSKIRVAIINDTVFKEGESHLGFKVQSIKETSVTILLNNGTQQQLTLF